jgi:hypothetical protein
MTPARVCEMVNAALPSVQTVDAGVKSLTALSGGSGPRSEREAALEHLPGGLSARCAECMAAGAIDTVVSVLAAHATNVQLCEHCCLLLCNLTSIPQTAQASVAKGAVPAVLAALRAHACSASLTAQAARALLNIAIHGGSPEQLCLHASGGPSPPPMPTLPWKSWALLMLVGLLVKRRRKRKRTKKIVMKYLLYY